MIAEPESDQERAVRMALDPRYPTDFEWEAMIARLPGYEAGTVRNLRLMVAWLRKALDGSDAEIERLRAVLWNIDASKGLGEDFCRSLARRVFFVDGSAKAYSAKQEGTNG